VTGQRARLAGPAGSGGKKREVGPDRLFDQTVLDGVMGQLGVGFHPHLVEKPRAVSADRFDAEAERIGDLGDGFA